MHRRFFLTALGGAALAGCAGGREAARSDIDLLSGGGYVIYFRHGATDRGGNDLPTQPREEQRLLSDLGIQQSEMIGAGFRRRGIPVDQVRSSVLYRCREMGEIAFGEVTIDPGLLSAANEILTAGARVAYLRRVLSTPRESGGNLVLISHSGNIAAAAGVSLEEGEAAVFRPLGGGEFDLIGTVMPEDW